MSASAEIAWDPLAFIGRERLYALIEKAFIYGTVMLIPYDLPVVHEACLPLAVLGMLLMILRRDLPPFLRFLHQLRQLSWLTFAVCVVAALSLYVNLDTILASRFQSETGWQRAAVQWLTLIISVIYPFYFAFCLRRHDDWQAIITRAAWLSMPLPLFVGSLQMANMLGVPHLDHLPYVAGTYEGDKTGAYVGGAFRLTSVARESSWFGSYVCVVLPFLIIDVHRMARGWRRRGAGAAIGFMLVLFVLGFSKSAYAGIAVLFLAAGLVIMIVKRPWHIFMKGVFALFVSLTLLFVLAGVTPAFFGKVTKPFEERAELLYLLFEPLIAGDTKSVSISTRFGMSAAGLSIGNDHPVAGVGLGQFGFYANTYTPLWGINPETLVWLSNDAKAWPSTSNLYARIVAEIGWPGLTIYILFRLLLLGIMARRVLDRKNPDWARDVAIFSSLMAEFVFDQHRDSFIDLDGWATMGLALAVAGEAMPLPRAGGRLRLGWTPRRVAAGCGVCFCLVLGMILMRPITYQATASVVPKNGNLEVADAGDSDLAVQVMGGRVASSFTLFRTYWASRAVAARIIARHPDLARRVIGDDDVSPEVLAAYITANIIVLMADDQTTLTFQYRNRDPQLAERFLTTVIAENDQAVATSMQAAAVRAQQLSALALQQNTLDMVSRQTVLSRAVGQELQSAFDRAGTDVSFDFIERPHVLRSQPLPRPAIAFLFAAILAGFTTLLAVTARLWSRTV